jgi:hypothetical protein
LHIFPKCETGDRPTEQETDGMSASPHAKKPRVGAGDGPRDVCVVGVARTPVGSLLGRLATVKATNLAGAAIREAVARAGVDAALVEEVVLGHVLSAGVGQAPAKQAAVSAGLPSSVPCSTVNKVCASGMKGGRRSIREVAADATACTDGEMCPQRPCLRPSRSCSASATSSWSAVRPTMLDRLDRVEDR